MPKYQARKLPTKPYNSKKKALELVNFIKLRAGPGELDGITCDTDTPLDVLQELAKKFTPENSLNTANPLSSELSSLEEDQGHHSKHRAGSKARVRASKSKAASSATFGFEEPKQSSAREKNSRAAPRLGKVAKTENGADLSVAPDGGPDQMEATNGSQGSRATGGKTRPEVQTRTASKRRHIEHADSSPDHPNKRATRNETSNETSSATFGSKVAKTEDGADLSVVPDGGPDQIKATTGNQGSRSTANKPEVTRTASKRRQIENAVSSPDHPNKRARNEARNGNPSSSFTAGGETAPSIIEQNALPTPKLQTRAGCKRRQTKDPENSRDLSVKPRVSNMRNYRGGPSVICRQATSSHSVSKEDVYLISPTGPGAKGSHPTETEPFIFFEPDNIMDESSIGDMSKLAKCKPLISFVPNKAFTFKPVWHRITGKDVEEPTTTDPIIEDVLKELASGENSNDVPEEILKMPVSEIMQNLQRGIESEAQQNRLGSVDTCGNASPLEVKTMLRADSPDTFLENMVSRGLIPKLLLSKKICQPTIPIAPDQESEDGPDENLDVSKVPPKNPGEPGNKPEEIISTTPDILESTCGKATICTGKDNFGEICEGFRAKSEGAVLDLASEVLPLIAR
ncbi:hypothetical protein PTTG_28920 [Puccinia triticina 1-1 BBBD Race 1]|uniref:Uncharacterized protein n=1 Tax=Puccinia triticina (isolate 1-1 / race 1 (BBBD)) TaxID=630390 RepID=A0A180G7X4_PUCT1|nr:hypothetical protein PTTG_28920 [Puccinia triticina 1-1 BBBD Race 1]